MQVVLEGENDDLALLLEATVGVDPQWTVEGVYD
jgi:protein ImuB